MTRADTSAATLAFSAQTSARYVFRQVKIRELDVKIYRDILPLLHLVLTLGPDSNQVEKYKEKPNQGMTWIQSQLIIWLRISFNMD